MLGGVCKDFAITTKTKPICNVPEINYGSMANDGGNLLLSDDEKNELLLRKWLRLALNCSHFIEGIVLFVGIVFLIY